MKEKRKRSACISIVFPGISQNKQIKYPLNWNTKIYLCPKKKEKGNYKNKTKEKRFVKIGKKGFLSHPLRKCVL